MSSMVSTAEMSGARKVAILLLTLGTERAAAMLRMFSEAEVADILREVAELDNVAPEVIDRVVTDFANNASARRGATVGGADLARELLLVAVGTERADEVAKRMPEVSVRMPFEYLHEVAPRLAATFLADEHPQAIALVLSHLPASLAADLLAELPPEFRRDVAVRIATLDRASPEVVSVIDEHLAARFAMITPDDQRSVGGVDALVELLTRADDGTERAVVEGLMEVDLSLAEKVRSALFSFEDLVGLPDREVQQILRGVDSKDLAMALKGASEAVQDKMLGNLSSRASETLREEIELLGRVRMSDIEEARMSVLRVVRELEEAGTIVLERSGDDFVD